ncbi:MFS transporter [Sedimentibacter sp. B4]|uniref:MFS transporter n=1 Tax=Sedimentibacter sp. B4 TaxID=304766 RepID=UPI00030C65EE|nr:MFS transporter [Sedimentibacter sp. B4]
MKKASIGRLYLMYGLFSIFCNLAHPITPTMFIEKNFADYLFGVSYAAMSLSYFAGSLVFGSIGDSMGRVKTMAFVMPVYALSQFVFGVTDSAVITVIARLVAGFFSAGVFVCSLAYLVDLTTEEDRGVHMSYYVACNSVGAAFGYFIGGIIGNVSILTVITLQTVTIVICGIITYMLLEETSMGTSRFSLNISINPFKSYNNIAGKMPRILTTFLFAVFLTSFATTAYDNAFNYYLKDALGLGSSYNGIIKAVIGIITLVVNFTINIYIVKHTQTRKSLIVVLLLCGISAIAVPFISGMYPFFAGNILFFMFNAIYLPIQQDIVTNGQGSRTSGLISGIFNAVRAIGMIFGSLFSGFIYEWGNKLPFIASSIVFFISVGISVINLEQYKLKSAE